MASFDRAFPFLLENEGGFQADPRDSGNYDDAGNLMGTNFGITAKVAQAWGWTGPMEDLPLSLARDIYRAEYWTGLDAIQSDQVAAKLLDFFANFGRGGGTTLAQQAANEYEGINIAVDGGFGPQTVAAINSIDPADYMESLIQAATRRYESIAANDPQKAAFLPGWLNRVVRIPAAYPGASALLLVALGAAALYVRGK
jgi:lysozyme family protein